MDSENKKKHSINVLVKDTIDEFFNIILQNVELVKYEIKQDIRLAIKSLLLGFVCLFTAFCGVIFLGLFLVILLGKFFVPWVSVLLVALLYFAISLILLPFALNKIHLDEIKENIQHNIHGD